MPFVSFLIESPAGSDVIGTTRSRKGREKQNQSPIQEEEESESSSAKEDDVDSVERGSRSTPQRKATRRKRNEKNTYNKQESKDSAEDEESTSEYAWTDDKKDHTGFKGENKGKLGVEGKRKKGNKGRVGRPKNSTEHANENNKNYERQSSAMEILTDCALKTEAEFGSKLETNDLKVNDEEMEIDGSMGEENTRYNKRKSLKRQVKNESGSSKDFVDEIHDERSEKENIVMSGADENVEMKKIKTENNNINESSIGNENEIACMEHVVNILQQAAAIDAEKQRKSKENTSSPSHGRSDSAMKNHDKERRKRKRERKRRRRQPSCSVAEASESENSMQSPFRKGRDRSHSAVEFDKEKFDFVSDLSKFNCS